MQTALDDLVTLLALEPIEVNIFRGRSPDESRQRVFGGQVAGQALVAAARTVDDTVPAGPLAARLLPAARRPDGADPLRGRPAPRRPELQHPAGRRHPARPGHLQPAVQLPQRRARPRSPDRHAARSPGARDAAGLAHAHGAVPGSARRVYDRARPIDVRYVDGDPLSRKGTPSDSQRVWLRADGTLPDDPVVHACIVTYASDMTLLDTTVLPFGLAWDSPGMQMASLDHADVVPPPVPRRRLAALRPARLLDRLGTRSRRAARSSPATACSPSASCRKAWRGSASERRPSC